MHKRTHLSVSDDAPADTRRGDGRARPGKPQHPSSSRPSAPRRARTARNWHRGLRLFAAAALAAEAAVLLLANPYFHVTKVRVLGADTLTPDQVLADARVPAHTNVFLMLRRPLARDLAEDPVIDHASRAIRLPDTLVLSVTERRPRAALALNGRYWLLDPKGVPFRVLDSPPPGLPLVWAAAAVRPSDVVLGKPLRAVWFADVSRLLALLDAAPGLALSLGGGAGGANGGGAKITVDQNLNLCLNGPDRLQIRLGQSDSLPRKMALAEAAVSADGGALARRAAYIDVSCPQQPVWRPRPAAASGAALHTDPNGTRSETNTDGPNDRTD